MRRGVLAEEGKWSPTCKEYMTQKGQLFLNYKVWNIAQSLNYGKYLDDKINQIRYLDLIFELYKDRDYQ